MSGDIVQATLFEAEAAALLQRAVENGQARGALLDQASSVLRAAKLDDMVRALDKLRELERVVAVRVELIAKRVAEGGA